MYVIYDRLTTVTVKDKHFKTLGAAKAYMTRKGLDPNKWAIEKAITFWSHIEKSETRRNLMSGGEFTQRVNTPLCCDPSSETYWSM